MVGPMFVKPIRPYIRTFSAVIWENVTKTENTIKKYTRFKNPILYRSLVFGDLLTIFFILFLIKKQEKMRKQQKFTVMPDFYNIRSLELGAPAIYGACDVGEALCGLAA